MEKGIFSTPDIKEISYALERLSEYISGFLGFNYRIGINEGSLDIYIENEKFILPYIENLYNDLFNIIDQQVHDLLENGVLIGDLQNLTENVSLAIIFNDFNIGVNIEKIKLKNFINTLKELTYLTYEGDPVNIGIYVCSNEDKLVLIQRSYESEFIQVSPTDVKKFFISEKPLIKLINNQHFNLVVNKDYKVVGILKKKPNGIALDNLQNDTQGKTEKLLYLKSIINEIELSFKDQLEGDYYKKIALFANEDEKLKDFLKDKNNRGYIEKLNVNINNVLKFICKELKNISNDIEKINKLNDSIINTLYLNVKSQEIEFWNNGYFPISYKKGQWKIRSFMHLAHEISACRYLTTDSKVFNSDSIYPDINNVLAKIIRGNPFSKVEKKLIKEKLLNKVNLIKEDAEYIFKLIDIVREMSKSSVGGLFVLITDEEYFNANISNIIGEKKCEEVYKSLIRNGVNNPHIRDIDADIISLIASIDGATLLNKDFTIYSFSEMIKSQNINTEYIGKTYGSRTLAAPNATLFGTAIKVSEDGDITVYRNVIYKNEKKELSNASMKVLSI